MSLHALFNDRFLVEANIAHGGFATIYQALDRTLGNKVAVKLGPVHSDPGYAKTIREEARILSRMSHRCVVKLHMLPRAGKASTYEHHSTGHRQGADWLHSRSGFSRR